MMEIWSNEDIPVSVFRYTWWILTSKILRFSSRLVFILQTPSSPLGPRLAPVNRLIYTILPRHWLEMAFFIEQCHEMFVWTLSQGHCHGQSEKLRVVFGSAGGLSLCLPVTQKSTPDRRHPSSQCMDSDLCLLYHIQCDMYDTKQLFIR